MEGLGSIPIIYSDRRTLSIEVDRGCVVRVRAPAGTSMEHIRTFVESRRCWILNTLERQRKRREAAPPPPSEEETEALMERASRELPPRVARYGAMMGVTPAGITITNARTRYGSCSGRNRLSFSCFLMNCPEEAIDLVVVHELAHIREKNHGPRFYAMLAAIFPDYRERKKLLVMPRWE